MSAISNINNVPAPITLPQALSVGEKSASLKRAEERDTVDFSSAGRALAEAAEQSSFRLARLRAIRAEIQAGHYETPDKIEATARRLLQVLR